MTGSRPGARRPTGASQLVLAFSLALACAPARAEWVRYPEDSAQSTRYFDPATLAVRGTLRRVWERSERNQPSQSGSMSYRILREYDCRNARSRNLSFASFSGPVLSGDLLYASERAGAWENVTPGSAGDEALRIVCTY